jgi:rubrerythrin
MASIKGTKTEQNLLKAFAGESQARNRYSYAASAAKKEGYEQIASLFLETAEQEKQHAKRFFRFLEGGMLEITAAYPAGVTGNTIDNLKAAAAGEHEEWTDLYPGFARIAKEEGFPAVAAQFTKKPASVKWVCRECGYVHEGPEAPKTCPCCEHPQAFFQVMSESY